MTVLEIEEEAMSLAEELVRAGALPDKAENDALHIAIAAIHRIPYLIDLELPAYGQRRNAAPDRKRLCDQRIQGSNYLYP